MFTVRFDRDSVCMGDDIEDHSMNIEFYADSSEVRMLIPTLYANSFLPCISGNDVMWRIVNTYHEMVLEYYTKSGKTVWHVRKSTPIKDICGDKMTLHCVYVANYK